MDHLVHPLYIFLVVVVFTSSFGGDFPPFFFFSSSCHSFSMYFFLFSLIIAQCPTRKGIQGRANFGALAKAVFFGCHACIGVSFLVFYSPKVLDRFPLQSTKLV